MRAACGWERGRSGQGKYNEEASGSWVVNAWGSGRSRSARDADKQYAGGGRGCAVGRKALRGAWRAPWETLSLQLPLVLLPLLLLPMLPLKMAAAAAAAAAAAGGREEKEGAQ